MQESQTNQNIERDPSTPTSAGAAGSKVKKYFASRWRRIKEKRQRPSKPAPEQPKTIKIGRPNKEPLRALAFAGGGFDTAIQLGVTHALLVSNCEPPDVVVGVSAGAVNAVALAEVLQAGSNLEDCERRLAQVAKFREILETYRNVPEELLAGVLPDPYEVTAKAPLKPQELPIHFEGERSERSAVVNARFGIIRLLNGLLAIHLKLSTITRIVRRLLELRRLNERRGFFNRSYLKFKECVQLWILVSCNLFELAPAISRIAFGILFAGRYQALVRRLEKEEQARHLSYLRRVFKNTVTRTFKFLLQVVGFYAQKDTKSIILQSPALRWCSSLIGWVLEVASTVALWSVPWIPLAQSIYLLARHNDRFWWTPLATYPIVIAVLQILMASASWGSLRSWLLKRFLSSFDLQKDLSTPFLLKPVFVRLFDKDYYGQLDIAKVIENALSNGSEGTAGPNNETCNPKTLRSYCLNKPPIYVAPIAADVSTGKSEAVLISNNVVDALLAATAVVPFFRAQKLGNKFYIDGINIANEPTEALMQLLSTLKQGSGGEVEIQDPDSPIEVYPVSPFPVSGEMSDKGMQPKMDKKLDADQSSEASVPYSGLVESVIRARQLQRLQDASLERQMVELYNRALPTSDTFQNVDGATFVRVSVHPIEPDEALNLNERVARAVDRDERRRLIIEAVADGCRATLELALAQKIKEVSQLQPSKPNVVECRAAMRLRFGSEPNLPGSASQGGPGIAEVCRHCAIGRASIQGVPDTDCQKLAVPSGEVRHTDWPIQGTASSAQPRRSPEIRHSPTPTIPLEKKWPADREHINGNKRPTISLLFSGGVFRGVFQIGVVNALNEVGLQPDLIAGSSVGSITAALVGEVFSLKTPEERQRQIALLAGTFLAIDRLVLTDRFSDFIRRLTLRAAECHFSLADVDRFLRRYDREDFEKYSRRSRRVIAGLERLFYLNPFELKELVKTSRNGEKAKFQKELGDHLQEFLNRSGVGQEILGTEPLALLIREHVLRHHAPGSTFSPLFNLFVENDIHFLATTTNLTKGKLDILSSLPRDTAHQAVLSEGLLASSAFPGLFRPRLAWEVYLQANTEDKFVDGGVMDNLPLDAVVKFLNCAHKNTWIAQRPQVDGVAVPHLIFTASLEIQRRDLEERELQQTVDNWPALFKRARQLKYNQKIDKFAEAQRNFRKICETTHPKTWNLLDIEAVVVKPEWLPSTFAFNPMIGFRRVSQARSIAHGCASTLVELHRRTANRANWGQAWGINDQVDPACFLEGGLSPIDHGSDKCWFRKDVVCPMSPKNLARPELRLADGTRAQLAQIYRQCGIKSTHHNV